MQNLVLNYGYAHKDAAKTMNVSVLSIQRWVTQYRKERQGITPKNRALTPEKKRIQAREKQVIHDPWQGTSYKMTQQEFKANWNEIAVFSR